MFSIPTTAHIVQAGDARVIVPEEGFVRVNDETVQLTQYEHTFLLAIARKCGCVCTLRMLLDELYPNGKEPDLKILDVYAHYVRCKLEYAHEDAPRALRTVWGRGFAFGMPAARPRRIPQALGLPQAYDRWTVGRKERLIDALRTGELSQDEALGCYPDLSAAELSEWVGVYAAFGAAGLRATRTQVYGSRMAA